MARKVEFHAVEFFRGIRDQQAALLKGRSNPRSSHSSALSE